MTERDPRASLWVEVPIAPKYEVNALGEIRNRITLRQCKTYVGASNGYPYCCLWVGSTKSERKKKTFTVHRLVMSSFVGPREPSQAVRHLDGNRLNCSLSNLAYGSYRENEADKARHGRVARGERNGQAKLSEPMITKIRQMFATGQTQTDIARSFGVDRSTVYLIREGKKWKHVA